MTSARDVMNAASVHYGERYVGEVIELRCGLYQATNADGQVLATFSDPRAAAAAVLMQAAHGR